MGKPWQPTERWPKIDVRQLPNIGNQPEAYNIIHKQLPYYYPERIDQVWGIWFRDSEKWLSGDEGRVIAYGTQAEAAAHILNSYRLQEAEATAERIGMDGRPYKGEK